MLRRPQRCRRLKSDLVIRAAAVLATLFLPCANCLAQGSAELTLQTYQSHDGGVLTDRVTAMALRFSQLQPGFGLISGNLNGGNYNSAVRRGESYVSLDGIHLLGGRFGSTLGDFNVSIDPLFQPNSGLTVPNAMLTGVLSTLVIGNQHYSFFDGSSYLLAGSRIPARLGSGQRLLGAMGAWTPSPNLKLSARIIHSGASAASALQALLSPTAVAFQNTTTGSVQALYAATSMLDFYGEAAFSAAKWREGYAGVSAPHFSGATGAHLRWSYVDARFIAMRQSTSYLPITGFYSNGRSGVSSEVRVRPWSHLQLFGSTSSFSNVVSLFPTEEHNQTKSSTAGFELNLGKTSISGDYSSISATYSGLQPVNAVSKNGYLNFSVTRQLGRQILRASWENLGLTAAGIRSNQKTLELEDGVRIQRAYLGGALRYEKQDAQQQPANIAARFFWNWSWRTFATFGSFEKGNDLAARSILTTSGTTTSTFGFHVRLKRDWTVEADALRTRLLVNLNVENTALLLQTGVGATTILNSNQWIVYAAIRRSFSWHGGDSIAHVADMARSALPQTGSVGGLIMVRHGDNPASATAGIPVILDSRRQSTTGSSGQYFLADVSEGVHILAVDVAHLPVDFDPPDNPEITVVVGAHRTTRSDFTLQHVVELTGLIHGNKDATPEGVVIKLDSGQTFTSADATGHFQFSNVTEGRHRVSVDLSSLPKDQVIKGSTEFELNLTDKGSGLIQFELFYAPVEKPTRRIFLGNAPPQ